MAEPRLVILDFETEAIGLRPHDFPPKSVGVAIDFGDGTPPVYYAWGHPSGNNTTWELARQTLEFLFASDIVVTHNGGAFDLVVAHEEFGIPWPAADRWHDTMFLRVLNDPYAPDLTLKGSCEKLLNIQPVERDNLRQWIIDNVPEATAKNWGAYIAKAPAELVAPYACADVRLTRALYDHLMPKLVEAKMEAAYLRDKKLAPLLAASEKRGVRVDVERLEKDTALAQVALENVESMLLEALHAHELDFDSDDQLANALDLQVPLKNPWVKTATGKRSTAKAALAHTFGADTYAIQLLNYRASLATCVRMFMLPWLEMAKRGNGRIHPRWNQVRGERGQGARTGRLSCDSPNLGNVPKEFDAPPDGMMPLPQMRSYLLPEEGHVWLRTDAAQQELRVLAHFEDGPLMKLFNDDPRADMHTLAQKMIEDATGIKLSRKQTKTIAFSIMYGAGVTLMAERLGCSHDEAHQAKAAYLAAIPGILTLQRDLKWRAIESRPFRTWGGRVYYVEPAKQDKKTGMFRDFAYKMLNTLVQGSAGDLMKQAIINYHENPDRGGVFLLSVYDEMNVSVPGGLVTHEATVVQHSFAHVALDVPMLSESSFGSTYGDSETTKVTP